MNFQERANDIWSIANLLRGYYKQHDYGKVILPFTILRRLDELLEPTKEKVLAEADRLKKLEKADTKKTKNYTEIAEIKLNTITGYRFHNKSKFTLKRIVDDATNIQPNLRNYINGFSIQGREIFEYFEFDKQIAKLDEGDLLLKVAKEFSTKSYKDLKALEMGYVFEHLIRKFAEVSNETAGEHFTPREIIELMVNILFEEDSDALRKSGIVRTLYDPACGTGGMLSIADMHLKEMNSDARLELFGQEINPESYAICKSEMLIKNQNPTQIKFGNTFTTDGLEKEKFDYMLSNPPFGVEWKKEQKYITDEHNISGFSGRFGAGLPRINDGSLLFLLHMMSKMKSENNGEDKGTRIGIIFNGSPLFNGSAGSGESEIRKWIIEKDYLETIIALPDQLFYNTGISTYLWIVTNRKSKKRKGKVQLINATAYSKDGSAKDNMRSLGNKRKYIAPDQIAELTKIYGEYKENKVCKIFDNTDLGYNRITVERPKKEKGKVLKDKNGKQIPDADFRDYENIPLKENIQKYFDREVKPHLPDAWIDENKTKVGYEINFTKYFYEFKPLRSLNDIRKDILNLEKETEGLIEEVIKQ
ncbi:MAG TPA: class I SAM-dependent DNA methyltransferase [Bacteroidia bacterium]|nr:class I SAM-dependent DNA methyltransferase [Bacteroidia bacterium]